MKRIQGTEGVSLLECVNPAKNRWAVRTDVQANTGMNEQGQPATGTSYFERVFDHEPTLAEAQFFVAECIDAFDCSSEVNGFSVNGMSMWLDKPTRTILSYTISVEEANTEESNPTIRLWYAGVPPVSFNIPTEQLKLMLAKLELYAKATYDITQSHKAAVYALETVEDVLNFDIRADYPEKLAFSL